MKRWKGPIYLFFGFMLAGTSVISARIVSGKLGCFTITVISMFFSLLFLLPVCRKKIKKAICSLTSKDLILLFVQALFGIFLFRFFLLNGILRTSTGEAGILTGATPAITAIFAMLLLKEQANIRKVAGIFSTAAGTILVQALTAPGPRFSIEHFWGNALVLCAAVSESVFNTFSRIFTQTSSHRESPIDSTVQTAIVCVIALLLCIIPAFNENPISAITKIGLKEYFALLWYGIFVTALAFILWYSGIKQCSAFTAAAFSGMMPFTSLLLSVLLLREPAGYGQWLGGALIILGMAMLSAGNDMNITTEIHNSKDTERVFERRTECNESTKKLTP